MWEKAFFVILGSRCNLSCRHCYNDHDALKRGAGGDGFLSRERLAPLFEALVAQGFGKVFLSGGEPLLHDEIEGVVGDATRSGLKVAMFSNGELLSRERIARLSEAGLKELRISLNELCWSASDTAWEAVLRRKTQWVEALAAGGIGLGYIFIISGRNMGRVDATTRRLRAMGAGVKLQPLFLPPHLAAADAEVACSALPPQAWRDMLGGLEAQCEETDFSREAERFPVYGNPWKLLRYARFLADYFVNGRCPTSCPTGPLLVVGPDGVLHPCLFRFDLSLGELDDRSGLDSLDARLGAFGHLGSAACFREECLSAYR